MIPRIRLFILAACLALGTTALGTAACSGAKNKDKALHLPTKSPQSTADVSHSSSKQKYQLVRDDELGPLAKTPYMGPQGQSPMPASIQPSSSAAAQPTTPASSQANPSSSPSAAPDPSKPSPAPAKGQDAKTASWAPTPSPEDQKLMEEFHLEDFGSICEDTIYHSFSMNEMAELPNLLLQGDSVGENKDLTTPLLQLWFHQLNPQLVCGDDGILRLKLHRPDLGDDQLPVIKGLTKTKDPINPVYRSMAQVLNFDPEAANSPFALVGFIGSLGASGKIFEHLSKVGYFLQSIQNEKVHSGVMLDWKQEDGEEAIEGEEYFLFIPKYARQVVLSYDPARFTDGQVDITNVFSIVPSSLHEATVIVANYTKGDDFHLNQFVSVYRDRQVSFQLDPDDGPMVLPPDLYDISDFVADWIKQLDAKAQAKNQQAAKAKEAKEKAAKDKEAEEKAAKDKAAKQQGGEFTMTFVMAPDSDEETETTERRPRRTKPTKSSEPQRTYSVADFPDAPLPPDLWEKMPKHVP